MVIAFLIVTAVTVLANAYAAAGDFLHTDRTVAQAQRVGVSARWLAPLGIAKAAGAAGLLAGVFIPAIGLAAATGLILYFVCAVGAHVRVHWFSAIAFPAIYLALATGALVLRVATL